MNLFFIHVFQELEHIRNQYFAVNIYFFILFLFWETTEIYFSGEDQCSVCYRRAFPNLRATIGLGYIGFGWYIPPLTGPLVSLKIAQINTKKNCFTFTSDHSVYDCIRLDTWMIPNQTKSLILFNLADKRIACFEKDSESTTASQLSRLRYWLVKIAMVRLKNMRTC